METLDLEQVLDDWDWYHVLDAYDGQEPLEAIAPILDHNYITLATFEVLGEEILTDLYNL